MTALAVVVAVGAGSYLLRVSMLVLTAHVGIPPIVERAARDAVPVSFAALAATAVAPSADHGGLHALAPGLALVVAAAAVRVTGRRMAALLAGMPALWVFSAVLT